MDLNAIKPPIIPINTLSLVYTYIQQGVIATKPPNILLIIISIEKYLLLKNIQYRIPITPPPMDANTVVVAALLAYNHLYSVIPIVLPQLKPNHPHHNINNPKIAFTGELGIIFLFNLGFNSTVPTKPVKPPIRCTGPAPAKSITPRLFNQPLEFHTQ